MAMHTDLPIHKKASDLLVLVARICAQIPRAFKRQLSEKITNHCVEMLEHMVLANITRHSQRAKHIEEILKHIRPATEWLRVAFNLKAAYTAAEPPPARNHSRSG